MSTYKSARRDAAVADAAGSDRHLFCSAEQCPHRWSVDMGKGRLCTFHDRAPAHDWPRITQQQLDRVADRARQVEEPPLFAEPLTRSQKVAILGRMRDVVSGRTFDPHGWAKRLQAKRADGVTLSAAQAHCLAQFERNQMPARSTRDEDPLDLRPLDERIRERNQRASA